MTNMMMESRTKMTNSRCWWMWTCSRTSLPYLGNRMVTMIKYMRELEIKEMTNSQQMCTLQLLMIKESIQTVSYKNQLTFDHHIEGLALNKAILIDFCYFRWEEEHFRPVSVGGDWEFPLHFPTFRQGRHWICEYWGPVNHYEQSKERSRGSTGTCKRSIGWCWR